MPITKAIEANNYVNYVGLISEPPEVGYGSNGSIMRPSGSNHAPGLVPDPPAVAGTARFLREDATWTVPPGGGTGTGSVTSVSMVVPSGLSVTGSPITDTGTITITTALSGIIKGTGSGFAVAVAGTDYLVPSAIGVTIAAQVHTHNQSDITNLTTDLSAKAPLASPALTGIPTSPTAAANTNTTQIATCAFVMASVSGLQTIAALAESVQDIVGAMSTDSSTVDFTYDDTAGTLTAAVIANTSTQRVQFSKAGTLVGTRKQLNLIEGTNVTLIVTDNAGSDRVDVTIASAGSGTGGYSGVQEEGSDLTARTKINFIGAAVTAVDDAVNTRTNVTITALLPANNLSDLASIATARTNLGLVIGTNVQAWDADLDAVAGLSTTGFVRRTGASTFSASALVSGDIPDLSATYQAVSGLVESVQDIVGAMSTDSTTVDFTYDDTAGTLTAAVIANTSNQRVQVSKAGTLIGTRKNINFIEGANVTIGVSDNLGSDRIDVTIAGAASGGGGYPTLQEEGTNLTVQPIINFIGSGITASNDAANTRTNITVNALLPANNLSDLPNPASARTNLGLGTSDNPEFAGIRSTSHIDLGSDDKIRWSSTTIPGAVVVLQLTLNGSGDLEIQDGTGAIADISVDELIVGSLSGVGKWTAGVAGVATEGTDYLSGVSNKLPFPMGFAGSGTPTVGTDKVRRPPLPFAMTAVHLSAALGTAPTGGPFTVTIKRSSNSGSTFPDTVATLSIAAGSRSGSTTTFTTPALLAGDILSLDIGAVNTAADWILSLTALSRNQ